MVGQERSSRKRKTDADEKICQAKNSDRTCSKKGANEADAQDTSESVRIQELRRRSMVLEKGGAGVMEVKNRKSMPSTNTNDASRLPEWRCLRAPVDSQGGHRGT